MEHRNFEITTTKYPVKVYLAESVAPDYVFENHYDLKSLEEVDAYIIAEGHLPNISSAEEMKKEGINLKEMNLKLLEKVEELTLYTLDLNKAQKELKKEIFNLKSK